MEYAVLSPNNDGKAFKASEGLQEASNQQSNSPELRLSVGLL